MPTPAQSMRAAFSFMSPPAGQPPPRSPRRARGPASRGRRGARPRRTAASSWSTRARGRARRCRAPGSARRLAAVGRRDHPHRGVGEALQGSAQQAVRRVLRGRGRDEHDRARAPAAARRARPAAPTAAARRRAPTAPSAAGTRAAAASRPSSARARARCGRTGSGSSPSRRRVSLYWSRPSSSDALHEAPVGPAPQRRGRPGPRQPRADRVDRVAVGDERVDVGDQRRQRHALELGRQRGAGGEDVGDGDLGRERRARTAGSRCAARTAAA